MDIRLGITFLGGEDAPYPPLLSLTLPPPPVDCLCVERLPTDALPFAAALPLLPPPKDLLLEDFVIIAAPAPPCDPCEAVPAMREHTGDW